MNVSWWRLEMHAGLDDLKQRQTGWLPNSSNSQKRPTVWLNYISLSQIQSQKTKCPLQTDSERQWKLTSLKFQMNYLCTKKTRTALVCFGRDISKDSSSQQNWGLSPDNTDIWSLLKKKKKWSRKPELDAVQGIW